MVRSFLAFLVLCFILVESKAQDDPPIFVEQSAAIRKSLIGAKQIYIFEGLPHQRDVELLKSERLRKDTVEFADFPFYTPKVPVKGELAAKLKALASKAGSYSIFSGEKRCGGFHPDYALQWSDGEKNCKILFCYGCSEVIIVSGNEKYRYDCPKILEFRKLLEPFQLKRPDKMAK